MTRDQWLDTATSQIRFSPDRQRVRQELEDHMADRMDAATARGLTWDEANAHVLAAMGDPAVIAPELGRLHSPWLGRMWWAIRAVTVAALVVILVTLTDSSFWNNIGGDHIPAPEVPPEQQSYNDQVFTRTGLWEDLELGTVNSYHFQVPVAWVQRLTVTGEAGYEIYTMDLRLTATTWRVWEPWEPDAPSITVRDNTGCTYLFGDDAQTSEPFTPYFSLGYYQGVPGSTYAQFYLVHLPQTPEWLEITIGDAVLHIDLEGGAVQ